MDLNLIKNSEAKIIIKYQHNNRITQSRAHRILSIHLDSAKMVQLIRLNREKEEA